MGKSFMEDPYAVYVKMYGKVRGGHIPEDKDYRGRFTGGKAPYKEYDLPRRLAASLAVSDVKSGEDMRTKSDFEEELKRLLESPSSQEGLD